MVDPLNNQIQSLKDGIGMKSEFKWSEYRGGKKKATYEALVNLFYEAIDLHHMHFHAMLVDFDKFDHHKTGRGAPHLSINKMILYTESSGKRIFDGLTSGTGVLQVRA